MKRLNRRKLIDELEVCRQGFFDAVIIAMRHNDIIAERAFRAYHNHADISITKLGGESYPLNF